MEITKTQTQKDSLRISLNHRRKYTSLIRPYPSQQECTRMHGLFNRLTSRSMEGYRWYTTGGRGSAWSCKGDLTNRSLDVRLLDQSKELILVAKIIDYPLEN